MLKTKPFIVEVLTGAKSAVEEDKAVFVRAEPAATEIWEGQQLPLFYKLYFSNTQIANISILDESEYWFSVQQQSKSLKKIRVSIPGALLL